MITALPPVRTARRDQLISVPRFGACLVGHAFLEHCPGGLVRMRAVSRWRRFVDWVVQRDLALGNVWLLVVVFSARYPSLTTICPHCSRSTSPGCASRSVSNRATAATGIFRELHCVVLSSESGRWPGCRFGTVDAATGLHPAQIDANARCAGIGPDITFGAIGLIKLVDVQHYARFVGAGFAICGWRPNHIAHPDDKRVGAAFAATDERAAPLVVQFDIANEMPVGAAVGF